MIGQRGNSTSRAAVDDFRGVNGNTGRLHQKTLGAQLEKTAIIIGVRSIVDQSPRLGATDGRSGMRSW